MLRRVPGHELARTSSRERAPGSRGGSRDPTRHIRRAQVLYAQAADAEEAALDVLDRTKTRTLGISAVSLELLKAEFGAETPLAEITASRISQYKAKRLAAVRKIGEGETTVERGVTLKELQELLGHSSLVMTMRYAHLARVLRKSLR